MCIVNKHIHVCMMLSSVSLFDTFFFRRIHAYYNRGNHVRLHVNIKYPHNSCGSVKYVFNVFIAYFLPVFMKVTIDLLRK